MADSNSVPCVVVAEGGAAAGGGPVAVGKRRETSTRNHAGGSVAHGVLSGSTMMTMQQAPSVPGLRLNDDAHRRDEILGLVDVPYDAGVKPFMGIEVTSLRALVEEGFVLASARAPKKGGLAVGEFLAFMERWPEVCAHGFVISPDQRDYGVRIEGLECSLGRVDSSRRAPLREEFAWLCGDADDYFEEDDYLYAWWD